MWRRSELLRMLASLACFAVLQQHPVPARADPTLPDDELLEQAIEHQFQGHAWQAEAVLRRLAEAGQVVAMERLALMHWYGTTLYPGEAWSRDLAAYWFAQAAERGSLLGQHMSRIAQRANARAQAGR